jgi:hypothetical protein
MFYRKKAIFPEAGCLIFFGDIFGGRFGENQHQIIDYRYDKTSEIFRIFFNAGEICTVYNPEMIEYGEKVFTIKDASRIIWEWYYYGREKTVDNLNILDYKKLDASYVSLEKSGNLAVDSKIVTFEIKNHPALQFLSRW